MKQRLFFAVKMCYSSLQSDKFFGQAAKAVVHGQTANVQNGLTRVFQDLNSQAFGDEESMRSDN